MKKRCIIYGVLAGLVGGLIFDRVAGMFYPSGVHFPTILACGLLGGLIAIAWHEAREP